jgi:hypothetical protein
MNVAQLVELGFVEAGACTLDPALKSGVRFTLHRHQADRVIYAFAIDDEVKYIGVYDNTKPCFSDRMARYQGITGAGTNERLLGCCLVFGRVPIHAGLNERVQDLQRG